MKTHDTPPQPSARAATGQAPTKVSASPDAADQPAPSPIGPAQSTWTTYLYEGPGTRYSVIEEVPQATHFDVIGCANAWCEIEYEHYRGYVEQDIVAQGNPAFPAKGVYAQPVSAVVPIQPKGPCFMADQKGGNGGNAMTVFCEKDK